MRIEGGMSEVGEKMNVEVSEDSDIEHRMGGAAGG